MDVCIRWVLQIGDLTKVSTDSLLRNSECFSHATREGFVTLEVVEDPCVMCCQPVKEDKGALCKRPL